MHLTRLLIASALAVAALMSPTAQATAAPDAGAPERTAVAGHSSPDAALDDLISANPGARKISKNTVKLANGVEASVSSSAIACPTYNLCIYDDYGYKGYWIKFYKCGFVNIGFMGWSDRIRSYVNNQTRGTVSIFMDWRGDLNRWIEVERSQATESIPVERGARWADGLWVC